jgi:hypothetical protein
MIITFDILFRVRLRHSFYADGTARNLMVLPTRETRNLLDNNRLIFRVDDAGFFVAAETEASGPGGFATDRELKRNLPPGTRFRFHLVSVSPEFTGITSMSLTGDTPDVLIFSNRNGSSQNGSLLLHPSEFAGSDTASVPIHKERILRHAEVGHSEPGTATIRSGSGRVLQSQTVEPLDDTLFFTFDLGDLPSDRYALWFGNKHIDSWYHAAERFPGMLLGAIVIETGSGIADTHRLWNDQQVLEQPVFDICFQNRSTFWRYHVRNCSGITLNNPVILANSFTFSRKAESELPADRLLFESDQAIPLQEAGIGNISLRRQTGAATHLVLDALPNPGARFAEPDPVDYNKLYSDIFITL